MAHMSEVGEDQKFTKEAFNTNWVGHYDIM